MTELLKETIDLGSGFGFDPKAFPDEKMRSKKAQLAAAAVVRLGDEILQISDAEGKLETLGKLVNEINEGSNNRK